MSHWMDAREALQALSNREQKYYSSYYGFYSSWLGGFFREPWALLIPMDDHMVHRGDGVFEAVRLYDNAYFDLDAHLARLGRSAEFIGLKLPVPLAEVKQLCRELGRLCDQPHALLRVFVSRGPGDFGTNPYTTVGSQLHLVLTKITPPTDAQYANGVRAFFAETRAKEPPFSGVKSCNYLQNVLMKKEAVDKGFDFALSLDLANRVCEGSTENFAIVTPDKKLVAPKFDYTLRGTTLLCVLQLAEALIESGDLSAIEVRDIPKEELLSAREMAFIGTTLGVLPVRQMGEQELGALGPQSIFAKLGQLLRQEMATSRTRRTALE